MANPATGVKENRAQFVIGHDRHCVNIMPELVATARHDLGLGVDPMRACYLLALISCVGCGERPAPFEDRPLGAKVHFNAIHYALGKQHPRQLIVRGTLGGAGELELNPNHVTLGPDGDIQGSSLLGWAAIPVRIELVDTPDPDGKGRKVYDIVRKEGGETRKFSLVLAANEAGPHHLLVRDGDKVVGTYPLVDPDRKEQQRLAPQLAKASLAEQKAIAELRKVVGYSFRFRLESKDAVTFLYFPRGAGDISKLDPALQGLTNLTYLSFNGGKLGPEGLKSLRHMPSLKTLDFTDCDLDDAGLACVKDATQLDNLSFYGSRGLTDDGLKHLEGLQHLRELQLYGTGVTPTGRAALTAKLPSLNRNR